MSKDLNIIRSGYESADKEEFKRPDHTDFMTSAELKAMRWSGVRQNSISEERELWIDGEIKFKVSFLAIQMTDEKAWLERYAEYFGLPSVDMLPPAAYGN